MLIEHKSKIVVGRIFIAGQGKNIYRLIMIIFIKKERKVSYKKI